MSTVSLDQHHEATLLEASSEPGSTTYSSSEDLGDTEGGYAYAKVNHSGLSSSSSLGDSQDSEDSGYANPVDAIQQYLEWQRQQQEGGSNGDRINPYQSFEEIRRMRELQIQERERKESMNSKPIQRVPSNGAYEDNPGYSRPFDALLGASGPLKVTPEVSKKKLSVSPLPWQRTASPTGEGASKSPLFDRRRGNTFSNGTIRSPSNDSISSTGGTSGNEGGGREQKLQKQPSEEQSSLDRLPTEQRKISGSDQPNVNGSPDLKVMRLRSQSDSPTLEDVHSECRPTEGARKHQYGSHSPRVKPRAAPLERTVSDGSMLKMKPKIKPEIVTKLRSGQARVLTGSDAKKYTTK